MSFDLFAEDYELQAKETRLRIRLKPNEEKSKFSQPDLVGYIPVDARQLEAMLEFVRRTGKPVVYLDVAIWDRTINRSQTDEDKNHPISGDIKLQQYTDRSQYKKTSRRNRNEEDQNIWY